MNSQLLQNLNSGLETAFIDGNRPSSAEFRPQFVSNNHKEGKKVLASIEDELLRCERFQISVAFITLSGITPLLQTLKELENKGVPGEILTTNYLNFSEPKALEKLNSLSNIKLKMYDVDAAKEGFHTKGYIFKKDEIYRIIIGSSNITSLALTSNREWNTRIVSTENGELARQVVSEFKELWNSQYALDYEDFYEVYAEKFRIIQNQRKIASSEDVISLEKYRLQPNAMQLEFITKLRSIYDSGENRALLISATGTGKTYASAFAMRELGFKRVLFLVHRNQLAVQSEKSYKNVFGKKLNTGFITGSKKDFEADYIFATVQSLSNEENLQKYANRRDYFDCIIMDEAHHSPANTYQEIMKFFTPKLWVGMTATPDKRDDNQEGRNVYELFNYQIAAEIRLQNAMEEDMLCPFHYFGITDLAMVDDSSIEMDSKEFSYLTSDERVKHIIAQSEYYGFSGDKVKGLIFCRSIDESVELSRKFNELGFRTVALNGSSSEKEREDAFERLAMDECDKTESRQPLDYIFSKEILNEGIDIVEVNQVIMLRPTQSPIVFIQQLGRGLRKAPDKEYVVVLDFIGNYKNNFMIPIALSGDRTYNKDNVRRYVMEGDRVIPGASTVHFDEISRKKVFEAIDSANFSDLKLIKENYLNLRNKLGRIPRLRDFDDYGEMDVLRIFDNSNLGSYHKFLSKYEPDYSIKLNNEQENIIEFVSKKLANGKRIHELEFLNYILLSFREKSPKDVLEGFKSSLYKNYGKIMSAVQEKNVVNMMTNEFCASASRETYKYSVFIRPDGLEFEIDEEFRKLLADKDFYDTLKELVEFGISRYNRDYKSTYRNTDLVLYQKYTYEDVCRLLNWEQNLNAQNIGGYKFDSKTKTYPVFINYEKSDDISDTIKYEDHFVSNNQLIAISKSKRKIESNDVQNFIHAKERGIEVELFVRKNKDDRTSKEFYYLGRMTATGNAKEFVMENTSASAVEIEWVLDNPVREDIYEYIVNA